MDIIEQAAKRLEELRRAGVEVAPPESAPAADKSAAKLGAGGTAPAAAQISRRIDLDMNVLTGHGILTPDSVRSQLGDEMRVIKRPLLHNVTGKSAAPVKDANLIMITSALPGEGKTFMAANLAISIAMELDHTVLLVDADVARPSLPEVFGFDEEKGLLDVLTDPTLDLSQVLLRTNVEKLSVLPAGTPHPRATELLASEAMNHLLADMAQRYHDRIIIFDSPPLLVTTEARALAMHMGQVVLVVKAESTTHAEVKNAIAAIESCPVKMVVLNKTTGHVDGHGYGYGYGYG
ncbi:MAG: tyrosine-protein kinase family protein, partial [Rhodocyclaceae bacterium]|nr:tyrosine-protein kinase family protein [Rhodocyclaceae bacterium]